MSVSDRSTAVVAGLGEELGVALAGALADAGHDVVGLSRTARAVAATQAVVAASGRRFSHVACDLTQPAEVERAVAAVAGRIDVLVHAAHLLQVAPLDATAADAIEAVRRTSCLTAVNAARAIAPAMAARGRGTIIFCGAAASIRGAATFAAFASAKFALRGFAQSLARELGPHGVHVAHLVLDGLIDEPQTDARFGAAQTPRMAPMDVAAACVALARQPRTSWTQELDLRPAGERY